MSKYNIFQCLEDCGITSSSTRNRCNNDDISDTLCNKNICYFDYSISHDGYDEDGPKSDLYDLFFITKERNVDYECINCGNPYFDIYRGTKYCTSCEEHIDINHIEDDEDNDEIEYFYVFYHYRFEDWFYGNNPIQLINRFDSNNCNKEKIINYAFLRNLDEDDKNKIIKRINKYF